MLKLFASKQAPEDIQAPPPEKRYTRFPHSHTRTKPQQMEQQDRQPCQAAPVIPRRPVPRIVDVKSEEPSLADQLHTDAPVTAAVLRSALPLRFAAIDERIRDMAQDELLKLHESNPRST